MHAITRSGWIEVITGSMFSGKTEELIRRLRRAEIAEQSVAVFKPSIDDRYGEATIGSHDGRQWQATIVEPESALRSQVESALNGEDVVAIDEGNFFGDELLDLCEFLADDGRRVIVSGLDRTYRGEPFEPMPGLLAAAEYVDKLHAICTICGEPATRTQRLIEGEPAHVDEPTIVVGADETYEARCRQCHAVRGD
ncbi:thymidine kinase [Halalkalirubrum salinum]|uniref:thymidine kinase n=1 Tax=Halalkalirubrum salinum TaxID=2563889 RepID=UPI0010FB8B11|nr:thymidine kinase [Halalkalirubrum salinum]